LGCVLWQLPGNLHRDEEKLKEFLKLLDARTHHVIEFRHKSWFVDSVYSMLARHKIGFCMLSAPGNLPEDVLATSSNSLPPFSRKKAMVQLPVFGR
jgi:uncharacterized protein YecE (DUF72 family)